MIDKRGGIIDNPAEIAEVAELADAQDSKSCPGNRVWVQVPPSALFVARISICFVEMILDVIPSERSESRNLLI